MSEKTPLEYIQSLDLKDKVLHIADDTMSVEDIEKLGEIVRQAGGLGVIAGDMGELKLLGRQQLGQLMAQLKDMLWTDV